MSEGVDGEQSAQRAQSLRGNMQMSDSASSRSAAESELPAVSDPEPEIGMGSFASVLSSAAQEVSSGLSVCPSSAVPH